jgi:hypothetical protein
MISRIHRTGGIKEAFHKSIVLEIIPGDKDVFF